MQIGWSDKNLTLMRLVVLVAGFVVLLVPSSPAASTPRYYDFALFDFPYNAPDSTHIPSMQQSLSWSNDYYQFTHAQIETWLSKHLFWSRLSIVGFDALSLWMPLGSAWLHEEWHRNVFGQYNISSHNGIYDFDLFAEAIPVDSVTDDDLSLLKAEHPADFVRLHTAGMEAQLEQNVALEKQLFFDNSRTFYDPIMLFNVFNNIGYIYTCATPSGDHLTQEFLDSENTDISARDFTGLDCTAWMYDLARPDEPYGARGLHPSGTGINRYRTRDDLTADERRYLERQFYLSLLNMLDPFMWGRYYFTWTYDEKELLWNTNVRHYLTPFGYSIAHSVFLRRADTKLLATWHHHYNQSNYFAGIEAEWLDVPYQLGNTSMHNTLRGGLWWQPQDLRYQTTRGELGGFVALRAKIDNGHHLYPYVEAKYKTAGWLAGDVYLTSKFSVLIGMVLQTY
jgi:hypothetical protein